jgi:hypothetical protein
VLASYGGTYQFSDYRLAIAVEGSHFVAKFDDGAAMVFFAEWETKFSSKAWGHTVRVLEEQSRRRRSLTRQQNGQDETGMKK